MNLLLQARIRCCDRQSRRSALRHTVRIATELVVLAFIIYTPWGNAIFGTYPLPAWIFGPLALGALALLLAEESRKFIINRFNKRRAGGVMQRAVHHDR